MPAVFMPPQMPTWNLWNWCLLEMVQSIRRSWWYRTALERPTMVRESNSMLRQVRDKFEHPVQGKNGIHILKITWDHRMQTLPLQITPRVSTLKQPCSTVVKTDHRTASRAAGPLHPSPALSQGAHSSSLSSGVLVNWLFRGKNRAGGKAERGREQKK